MSASLRGQLEASRRSLAVLAVSWHKRIKYNEQNQ